MVQENIGDRIKSVRKSMRLSQTDFGNRIGVGIGVVKNIEYQLTTPSSAQLDLICQIYDVNRVWLETGEGEMFIQKSRDDEISIWAASLQDVPDSFKYKFAHALSKLNDRDWEVIEKVVQLLYDEETKKDEGI